MLSRRDLIGKAAVGAAAALAVGAVGTGVAAATRPLRDATDDPGDPTDAPAGDRDGQHALERHADAAVSSAPPPWELVAPFAAGAVVAHGWRLVDLTPVRDGSAVVTLQNAARARAPGPSLPQRREPAGPRLHAAGRSRGDESGLRGPPDRGAPRAGGRGAGARGGGQRGHGAGRASSPPSCRTASACSASPRRTGPWRTASCGEERRELR